MGLQEVRGLQEAKSMSETQKESNTQSMYSMVSYDPCSMHPHI